MGITGLNDLSAGGVVAEVDAALADVGLTTTITGRIDAAVSSRAPAATALSNATWTGAKAAFLDASISGVSTGGVSAATIATAVWQDPLAGSDFAGAGSVGKLIKDNLDATVSTRSTYAGGDTFGTTTLLSRLTSGRATNLENLDASIGSRSTYAGGAVASVTGNVGGNVAGSVGSVAGAVGVGDGRGHRHDKRRQDRVQPGRRPPHGRGGRRRGLGRARGGHVAAGTFGSYLDAAISGVSTGGISAMEIAEAVRDVNNAAPAAGSLGAAVAAIKADTGPSSSRRTTCPPARPRSERHGGGHQRHRFGGLRDGPRDGRDGHRQGRIQPGFDRAGRHQHDAELGPDHLPGVVRLADPPVPPHAEEQDHRGISVYGTDGTAVITTQATTDNATEQTVGVTQ